jgi:hypothetical protein
MADRQTRRTLKRNSKPSVGAIVEISRTDNGVASESGTVKIDDRIVDENKRNADNESDSVKSIGVVTVEPEQLGEFINGNGKSDTGDSSGSDRTGKRKYTRRNTKAHKETPQNIEALVTMVHTWASVLLKTPELKLEETEVKTLSDAYNEFCLYHEVPMLTPKRMSEVNLVIAALSIYGTRYVAIRQRMKDQKHSHGNVVSMPTQAAVSHG